MSNEFRFLKTDDGSPTLEITREDGSTEKMHHSGGAFSETLYVYGKALDIALENKLPHSYFILGLGLGYIEIMIAATLLSQGIKTASIWSTESDDLLIEQFLMWLEDDLNPQPPFQDAYNWILAKISQSEGVDPIEVKRLLKGWRRDGSWRWFGAYSHGFNFGDARFSVLFFDAFSDKVNPELWTEETLDKTLKSAAGESCVFATYASKGRLKKVLKENEFEFLETPGFGGKRECTIATRLVTK
jgi:hypothetical protein